MKQLLEITIYDIPKISLNTLYSSPHWTVRKKHKDLFNRIIYGEIINYGKDDIKNIGMDLIFEYEFLFKGKTLDVSNCFYMVKLIEDALVHNEIIKDDSVKYISKIIVSTRKSKQNILIIRIYKND